MQPRLYRGNKQLPILKNLYEDHFKEEQFICRISISCCVVNVGKISVPSTATAIRQCRVQKYHHQSCHQNIWKKESEQRNK